MAVPAFTAVTSPLAALTVAIVVFEEDQLPAIYNAVRIQSEKKGVKIDLTFRLSKESTLEVLTREEQTGKETMHVLATRDTPEQLRKKLADTAPPPEVKVGIVGFFKRLFWGGKKK